MTDVFNATHPHKFTWYSGDPLEYRKLLTGRRIVGAEGYGAFVDILLDDDVHLLLSDGVNLRLYTSEAGIPAKYQLLVTLDDERFLVLPLRCTEVSLLSGVISRILITGCEDEIFTARCGVRHRIFPEPAGRCEAESLGKGFPGHGATHSGTRERGVAGHSFPGRHPSQTQTRHTGRRGCRTAFQNGKKPPDRDDPP